jgi:hypothetical protein
VASVAHLSPPPPSRNPSRLPRVRPYEFSRSAAQSRRAQAVPGTPQRGRSRRRTGSSRWKSARGIPRRATAEPPFAPVPGPRPTQLLLRRCDVQQYQVEDVASASPVHCGLRAQPTRRRLARRELRMDRRQALRSFRVGQQRDRLWAIAQRRERGLGRPENPREPSLRVFVRPSSISSARRRPPASVPARLLAVSPLSGAPATCIPSARGTR